MDLLTIIQNRINATPTTMGILANHSTGHDPADTHDGFEIEATDLRPGSNAKAEWKPEIQSLIDWFITLDPPKEPFSLEHHQHVEAPAKFFESLRREIETGRRGPRARRGSLQSDLQRLKAYFSKEGKAE